MCEAVFSSVYGHSSAEFDSFRLKVKGLVSDQALQKTLRVLKEQYFTNCILIHRDPAHAVRIAVMQPMTRADEIASIFQVFFDGEHPLLETVIVWAEKLRDCQRRVLHVDGTLGGSLTRSLAEVQQDALLY